MLIEPCLKALSSQSHDTVFSPLEADKYNEHINGIIQELEQNINALMQSENWQKETEWDNYDRFCETVNRNFFMIANKLKAKKVTVIISPPIETQGMPIAERKTLPERCRDLMMQNYTGGRA